MREQPLIIIIYKYLQKALSKKEKRKLAKFTRKHTTLPQLLERLENEEEVRKDITLWRNIGEKKDPERAWMMVQKAAALKVQRQPSITWLLSGIAALLLLFLGIHFLPKLLSPKQEKAILSATSTQGTPGRDQAILTLSNGQEINLDTVATGHVLKEQCAYIMKTNSGGLKYDSSTVFQSLKTAGNGIAGYNTLITPRKGQYSIQLPDGSRIFLNNASTLRYPVVFSGKSRDVELTGEGYFEVAPSAGRPFRVHVIREGSDLAIDVLGTRFNVAAYSDDDRIKTSLLAGSVRISSKEHTVLLKPGEQLTAKGTTPWQRQSLEDPAAVIAWTKGQFHFDHEGLPEVLRQLERWYDIKAELRITGDLSPYSFNGFIDRTKNLPSILAILFYGKDIKFSLEGEKLIVTR